MSKEGREQPRRSLDAAGRQRRARKALEALEQDNFHDDPHAGLVMSKRAPKFGGEGRRRRGREARQRHRKNLSLLLEEEALAAPPPTPGSTPAPSYLTATAPPSALPPRPLCAVCGFPAPYTCVACGARHCGTRCLATHHDTRCLKYTQ